MIFFLFRLCWCYYWIIYFKNYIHKSICILSIIAHCQSFCCEYFFFSEPERFQSLGYICIYPTESIPLGVLADINEPYQLIPAENLSHFLPTLLYLKSFSFSHWVEEAQLQHWSSKLASPDIYSGFQEGSTGWSGSFYTSFCEELKPWDYSAFELGIEVS